MSERLEELHKFILAHGNAMVGVPDIIVWAHATITTQQEALELAKEELVEWLKEYCDMDKSPAEIAIMAAVSRIDTALGETLEPQ